MAPELNLDVDAPDKVAGVLSAAANAYQASAVELTAAWQDRHIPMIWAAIAGELDSGRSRGHYRAAGLDPNRTLSLRGGNWSSCPIPDLPATRYGGSAG